MIWFLSLTNILDVSFYFRIQTIYSLFASNCLKVYGNPNLYCFGNSNIIFSYLIVHDRPLPTFYRMVYFWFSLIFLIIRTFAVSLFAARLNDESKKPIKILPSIPSSSWNTDAKRLFDDVIFNTVALSGLEFFFLTRSLILRMAGTIVTYELVLLQFNQAQNQTQLCETQNL